MPVRVAEREFPSRASGGGGGAFGCGEDVGGVVVEEVRRGGPGAVAVFLRGGRIIVAAERFPLVDPRAHLVEEVLLLGHGRVFELGHLADGVAQAAFHAHRGWREAAAERGWVDLWSVAEFLGVLGRLE